MDWLPTASVVALALAFTYTNGFHDSANAVATSVSTRALTPRVAVTLAAAANLIGAFFGARVAQTVGSGIIEAMTFHLPVINVGTRQEGRLRDVNVIDVGYDAVDIERGLEQALTPAMRPPLRSRTVRDFRTSLS